MRWRLWLIIHRHALFLAKWIWSWNWLRRIKMSWQKDTITYSHTATILEFTTKRFAPMDYLMRHKLWVATTWSRLGCDIMWLHHCSFCSRSELQISLMDWSSRAAKITLLGIIGLVSLTDIEQTVPHSTTSILGKVECKYKASFSGIGCHDGRSQ